jgi:transcriptional regulator with XRE-family HTH domain
MWVDNLPNPAVVSAQHIQPVRQGGLVINVALARQRRHELGYSLKQLAILMQVDKGDLSRWENGIRVPRAHHIATWARCLELEPGDLFAKPLEEEANNT